MAGTPFAYWHFAKQKQQQLGLSQPETSADSMLFRVWITNPVSRYDQPHGLIEIKYDSTGRNGQLKFMKVDFGNNKLTATIFIHKKIDLPLNKTSFHCIAADLLKLKFDPLVTDQFIRGIMQATPVITTTAPIILLNMPTGRVTAFTSTIIQFRG